MAPAKGKTRQGYWNAGNDVTLNGLFDQRRVSTKLRKKGDIEPVRVKHFPEHQYVNFRLNYLKRAAQWELNQTKKGANTDSEKKRGEFLFCLL